MRKAHGGLGVVGTGLAIEEQEVLTVIIVDILRGTVVLGICVAGPTIGIHPDAETVLLLGLMAESRKVLTGLQVLGIGTGPLEFTGPLVLEPEDLDESEAAILLYALLAEDRFCHWFHPSLI